MKNYEDLVANVRGFPQESWFSEKGPSDMDLDAASKEDDFDYKDWIPTVSWDEMANYWEQQHQQDDDVDSISPARGRQAAEGRQLQQGRGDQERHLGRDTRMPLV